MKLHMCVHTTYVRTYICTCVASSLLCWPLPFNVWSIVQSHCCHCAIAVTWTAKGWRVRVGSAHLLVCDISLSLPFPTPHSPSSHRSLLTQHLLWEGVVPLPPQFVSDLVVHCQRDEDVDEHPLVQVCSCVCILACVCVIHVWCMYVRMWCVRACVRDKLVPSLSVRFIPTAPDATV